MTQLSLANLPPPPKEALSQWWTPPELANRIAIWAGITRSDQVLEPSAGIGALANAARARGASVFCVEIDPALCKILKEDGHDVLCSDFLQAKLRNDYSLSLQNTPFEDGQTEAHIIHALKFAPRVVCIAQLSVLAGVERKAELWDFHTLKRMVVFSRRPKFSGADATAKRDFCVLEIIRGRTPDAQSVAVEWWS